MKKFWTLTNIFPILIGIFSIIAVAFVFSPFYSEPTIGNSTLFYYGYQIAFGGVVSLNDNGIIYTTTFAINVWLLISYQLLILGIFGAFFGRRSFLGSLFTTILIAFGCVGTWMTPFFTSLINEEFLFSGVSVQWGLVIVIIFSSLSLLTSIFLTIFGFIKERKIKSIA